MIPKLILKLTTYIQIIVLVGKDSGLGCGVAVGLSTYVKPSGTICIIYENQLQHKLPEVPRVVRMVKH